MSNSDNATDLRGFYGVLATGAVLVGMWPEDLCDDDKDTLAHIVRAYGFLLSSKRRDMHPIKHSFAQFAQAIESTYSTESRSNAQIVDFLKRLDDMLLGYSPPSPALH